MRRCDEIGKLYGAYIYGDTTPEEAAIVREHLNSCEKCRADIETQEKVLNVMPNKLPRLSPEERQQIAWSVKAKIRETRERRTWWQAATPFVHTASLAASLIIVFAGGTLFGLHLREHLVSTSMPPPKKKSRPVSQLQPAPPEPTLEPNHPGEFQPPEITSGDPFIRSFDGTSRSGWNWRMSPWSVPEQNTETQSDEVSPDAEGTGDQPTAEESQPGEESAAPFDQTGSPFNPWMPVYPGLPGAAPAQPTDAGASDSGLAPQAKDQDAQPRISHQPRRN